jgi:hypothetical protein
MADIVMLPMLSSCLYNYRLMLSSEKTKMTFPQSLLLVLIIAGHLNMILCHDIWHTMLNIVGGTKNLGGDSV